MTLFRQKTRFVANPCWTLESVIASWPETATLLSLVLPFVPYVVLNVVRVADEGYKSAILSRHSTEKYRIITHEKRVCVRPFSYTQADSAFSLCHLPVDTLEIRFAKRACLEIRANARGEQIATRQDSEITVRLLL